MTNGSVFPNKQEVLKNLETGTNVAAVSRPDGKVEVYHSCLEHALRREYGEGRVTVISK